jgi:hypothetical protein
MIYIFGIAKRYPAPVQKPKMPIQPVVGKDKDR